MSRHIHFISLLFINSVLCYDYLDVNPHYRPMHRMLNTKLDDVNNYENGKGNANEEEAEIDVASFIRSPDYDRAGSNYQFEERNREQPYNNGFDSLVEANLEEYEDRGQDYRNIDIDALEENLSREKINQRQDNVNLQPLKKLDTLRNEEEPRKYYNNPNIRVLEKKCAFKNLKVPFFSHDQPNDKGDVALDTTLKKNKKRKLFHFNSKKQKPATQTSTITLTSSTTKPSKSTLFKLKKRSYFERICPLCRRKFIARRSKPTDQQSNIIHNSRQFYRNKEVLDKYEDESKRMVKDIDPEMKKNNVLDKGY